METEVCMSRLKVSGLILRLEGLLLGASASSPETLKALIPKLQAPEKPKKN